MNTEIEELKNAEAIQAEIDEKRPRARKHLGHYYPAKPIDANHVALLGCRKVYRVTSSGSWVRVTPKHNAKSQRNEIRKGKKISKLLNGGRH